MAIKRKEKGKTVIFSAQFDGYTPAGKNEKPIDLYLLSPSGENSVSNYVTVKEAKRIRRDLKLAIRKALAFYEEN